MSWLKTFIIFHAFIIWNKSNLKSYKYRNISNLDREEKQTFTMRYVDKIDFTISWFLKIKKKKNVGNIHQ